MAAGKGITKTLVWILMGMLVLGLGGFGVTNLSGNVRSVGSVGESDLDINQYARALQSEIRAFEAQIGTSVTFAQASQFGLSDRVLSQMVSVAALDDETRRMGISIGDKNLRDQIVAIPNFQGADGNFDRDAYGYSLDQAGLTEAEFEAATRADTSRTILQGAVVAGVNTPDTATDTLINFAAERRNVTWATLDRSNLETGLPEPTEEELLSYHRSHLPEFTSPEVKRITYAWLTPDMLLDSVEVDEAALREAYDARFDEFNQPERRMVERLSFADQAAAEAAKASIDSDETSFDALVEGRGLELSDVDMGIVNQSALDAAGAPVFSADAGDVLGPYDSPIGPALFRVNAVLNEQITTFEEARSELRSLLAADRARRVIDAQIENIDDLLAGGATIEDLADETDMKLGQIDWHPALSDRIGGYTAFRQAAEAVTKEDFPQVLQLEDDGIFALRLDEVVEPAIRPLDVVRDQVVRGWRAGATSKALHDHITPKLPALQAASSFEDIGLKPQTALALSRTDTQGDTPPEFIETVFAMQQGEARVIEGTGPFAGRIFVIRLDDIILPDPANQDIIAMRSTVQDQISASLQQDLFQLLANDIRSRVGFTLNQQALNAVHANFQ
jgi:peptidyl-prolyl cis-trans isomerase D